MTCEGHVSQAIFYFYPLFRKAVTRSKRIELPWQPDQIKRQLKLIVSERLFNYDFIIFYLFPCLIYAFVSGGQSLKSCKLSLTTSLSYTNSFKCF